MTKQKNKTNQAGPPLPPELVGATTQELIDRYIHLSNVKDAGEARAGRHTSGINDPANVDPDPLVFALLSLRWPRFITKIVNDRKAVLHF